MTIRINGIPLDEIAAGPRAVVSNPVTYNAVPPIQIARWCRNGSIPSAPLENLKNESLNQATMCRTKTYAELAFSPGLVPTSLAAADEDHWRWAFRSGPYAHAAYVHCTMTTPDANFFGLNSYGLLNIYTDATESTLHAAHEFYYGPGVVVGAFVGGWRHVREFDKIIELDPNTDYYCKTRRMQGASIVSMTMIELASLTEHNDGYLGQNLAAHEPILNVYREGQATVAKNMHQYGAGKIINWTNFPSGGNGWITTNTNTPKNVLDDSNTFNASTPGFYANMEWKHRSTATTVPCVMKAFAKEVFGSTGGVVELKDSAGNVVASITGWPNTGVAEWRSTVVNLPNTDSKYYLHYRQSNGASDFSLWAISLYESG